jgi:hypothetical protein
MDDVYEEHRIPPVSATVPLDPGFRAPCRYYPGDAAALNTGGFTKEEAGGHIVALDCLADASTLTRLGAAGALAVIVLGEVSEPLGETSGGEEKKAGEGSSGDGGVGDTGGEGGEGTGRMVVIQLLQPAGGPGTLAWRITAKALRGTPVRPLSTESSKERADGAEEREGLVVRIARKAGGEPGRGEDASTDLIGAAGLRVPSLPSLRGGRSRSAESFESFDGMGGAQMAQMGQMGQRGGQMGDNRAFGGGGGAEFEGGGKYGTRRDARAHRAGVLVRHFLTGDGEGTQQLSHPGHSLRYGLTRSYCCLVSADARKAGDSLDSVVEQWLAQVERTLYANALIISQLFRQTPDQGMLLNISVYIQSCFSVQVSLN